MMPQDGRPLKRILSEILFQLMTESVKEVTMIKCYNKSHSHVFKMDQEEVDDEAEKSGNPYRHKQDLQNAMEHL